jgi:4-methyl-5(b-hydroxyethyl)-thiazole monophosphate biosynthesis
MKVLVPLAQGFEEIEAVAIIDVLRRASIAVTTVHLSGTPVTGSHNIVIDADTGINTVNVEEFSCIVLPGGMPGSENLKNNSAVISLIQKIHSSGGIIAAICAAPLVLGHAGLLKNKNATCFPGFEATMKGAQCRNEPVVVDGNIVTGRGPGSAIPFALKLVELMKDKKTADNLKEGMQVYWM